MDIRDKLLRAVARYGLLDRGDRVLVGVSGGQDSLALLLLLHGLAGELSLELVVGHLHHGMRGAEADADQAYVGEVASRLDLQFVTAQTDVPALAQTERLGLEDAGRRARYRFFEAVADAQGCQKIALAHTATDRAETLMLNLLRGAGLYGLRSIPPRRGRIIRPLILATRQETAEFCRISGLRVCCDRTNDDPAPLRNRLRARLLPQLEAEFGPGVEQALCRAAEHAEDELAWTEPLVAAAFEAARRDDGLAAEAVRELPDGLRQRVLRRYVFESGHAGRDISAGQWAALDDLVTHGGTGRVAELSGGLRVVLTYDVLQVATPEPGAPHEASAELPVPGQATLADGTVFEAAVSTAAPAALPAADAHQAVMDAHRAGRTLVVRRAEPGDRFQPLGMAGTRKLQDFFVDNKVPPRERRPLLVARTDGEIVWVVGHRLAETARVDETTARYLTVSVSPRRT